jgi:hypothetical protein
MMRFTEKDEFGFIIMAVKLFLPDTLKLTDGQTTIPSTDNQGKAGLTPEERPDNDALRFIIRCARFHETLFRDYKSVRSRVSLQNHLLSAVEEDLDLVGGQLSLTLQTRANADFILHRAVSSPTPWLHILAAADGDVLVG